MYGTPDPEHSSFVGQILHRSRENELLFLMTEFLKCGRPRHITLRHICLPRPRSSNSSNNAFGISEAEIGQNKGLQRWPYTATRNVVVLVVVVVVRTLTHRYIAVRGHRTGSTNSGVEDYLTRKTNKNRR